MDFYSGDDNPKVNKLNKDCSKEVCYPNDLKPSTDNLGMKVIQGWIFADDPVERRSFYWDPTIYKINSGGETGRFFHMRSIYRYFRKGRSGTSGYFSSSGSQTIDCDQSYYGTINCKTTSPSLDYVPGTPRRASEVIQKRKDMIYDCFDETVAEFTDNKIQRVKGLDGKKRKWQSWDNIPEGRISYRLITNKKEKMKLRNNLCKNIGVNQDVILPSDLLQYKEKGIKK
tara:strand:- start:144 stop:827 length:684 start_codon:yes stop_codon:yes gene_type:complete